MLTTGGGGLARVDVADDHDVDVGLLIIVLSERDVSLRWIEKTMR
jgi:hypothetical protein